MSERPTCAGTLWRRVVAPLLLVLVATAASMAEEERPLEELGTLVGTWTSSIDPKYRDHAMIRRFNPDLKGQELVLRWGVGREVLHLQIFDLDRPEPGDRELVVEGSAVRTPGGDDITLLEYNAKQDVLVQGRYVVQPNGDIHRLYQASFAGGETADFREIWRFEATEQPTFTWITERRDGDRWIDPGVEVSWRKRTLQLTTSTHEQPHARLDFLVGTWEHEEQQQIGGEPVTVSSKRTTRWLPGRVWLASEATIWGLPGIDEHHGWGYISWDAQAGEYVDLWFDNQSGLLFESRGNWSDDETLVLHGSHVWNGENVDRTIVYRRISDNEYHVESSAHYASGATRSSLRRQRRVDADVAEGESSSAKLPAKLDDDVWAPLEWLIGSWQGEFRPNDAAAPTMSFSWGDARRSWLRFSGTRPTADGSLVPEYEMMIVWHAVRRRFVFLTTYFGGRVMEEGDIEILPVATGNDAPVRFNMRVHYRPGAALPFSDGAKAGSDGHTLEFVRTLHPEAAGNTSGRPTELRGTFLIKRGPVWEPPQLDVPQGAGFPWRRLDDAGS